MYALCKLTWITKGGEGELPDNTGSVVAPALSTLAKVNLVARSPSELGRELRRAGASNDLVKLALYPIGFTNFYGGFRNIAREWVANHQSSVWDIFHAVAGAETHDDVRGAYASVEKLPSLPRPNAGDLPASSLLTPTLACLDPHRAPIINSRDAVKRRLRMLGLSTASLVAQYEGLSGLIGQAGIDDAFALDQATDDQIRKAMKKTLTIGEGKRTQRDERLGRAPRRGSRVPPFDRRSCDET